MRNLVFLIPLLLIVGCSGTPKRPENPDCLQVANYARTIAVLRDMGVKENEIDQFSHTPFAVTFPYRRLREEVFQTQGETPAHIFVTFYDKCDLHGYSVLLHTLDQDMKKRVEEEQKRKEEEAQRKKDEELLNLKPPKPRGVITKPHPTKKKKVTK